MGSRYKLKIKQGDTFRKQYGYRKLRRDTDGNPVLDSTTGLGIYDAVDMTGWTGTLQIKDNFGRPVVVQVTENQAGAQGALTFANGFFTVYLKPAATALIKPGMLFGIKVIDLGGTVLTLWEGLLDVELAVSV